jgi:hypothetical protein
MVAYVYRGGCQMSWEGKHLDIDFVSALTVALFPGLTLICGALCAKSAIVASCFHKTFNLKFMPSNILYFLGNL